MSKKPKILLVDDAATIRRWVASVLHEEMDLVTIDSSIEAALAVYREKPDLVLMDVAMPVLEGDSVISLARESAGNKRMPVVLFSSLPVEVLAQRAAACGADGYIGKTSNAQRFKAAVWRFLLAQEDPESQSSEPELAQPRVFFAAENALMSQARRSFPPRFSLASASTGRETLEALRLESVALLVVGPDLPDMSAARLCSMVRSQPSLRQTPILFLAAANDQERAPGAVSQGANKCLVEPFSEEDLHAAVTKLTNVAIRRNSRLVVRIAVQVASEERLDVGFTANLSASGMLLSAPHRPAVTSTVGLRFFLPGRAREIAATALVIRHDRESSIYAVEYLDIDSDDRAAIAAFCEAPRA